MGNINSRALQIPLDIKNCENWYRLELSLELCVKPALLNILHDPTTGLPKDEIRLHAALLPFKTRAKRDKNLKKLISDDQWDVMCHTCKNTCPNLCTRAGKTNSNDFDITLIVLLIRNCTKLPAPRGGDWRNIQSNDKSKSANVVRAKQKRNKLNHSAMAHFSNYNVFKKHRNDIRTILKELGVTDFKKFNSLEEEVFINKQTKETETLLNNRKKCIKEAKWVNCKNKISLLQELEMLDGHLTVIQSDIQSIKHTVESVKTVVENKNQTKLSFSLNLTKPIPFTNHEVKITGLLHRHIVNDLKIFFNESCGDMADSFKILITEIVPQERNDSIKISKTVKLLCEVKSIDTSCLYKLFEDSLESQQTQEIISKIENNLVSSIKRELQIDSEVFVSKWQVGSLFIDVSILHKTNGKIWENATITKIKGAVNRILESQFNKAISGSTNHYVVINDIVQKTGNMQCICVAGTITLRSNDLDNVIECVNKFDDTIFKHLEKPNSETKVWRKMYEFNKTYASIIIGSKGSNIKRLKTIPDIIDVWLDTESSPTYCRLSIEAYSESAIQKVYDLVNKKTDVARYAKFTKTLIESKQREIVLNLFDGSTEIPVVLHKEKQKHMYTVKQFKSSNLEDTFSELSIQDQGQKNNFEPFTIQNINQTFQNVLDDIDMSKVQTIDFNVIPGKIVFLSHGNNNDCKLLQRNASGCLNVAAEKLKPIYITFLNPTFKESIFSKLKGNSFSYINEDSPEIFTNVHLNAVNENVRFSVSLALDENLDGVKEIDDPRLSENKKQAIERVIHAKTVGDVLQKKHKETAMVSYRRLSLLLHPDKNSHPGATEAFKKLLHAYKTIEKEKRSHSTLALTVDTVRKISLSKPPKVLSVKKNKNKICTITLFSEATLDLRASFVTMETDPDGLSEHVKEVLNSCWDNRDEHGGIQTPDGKTGISISCIKQITAGHIWVKEIPTTKGPALLEVTVKEIREKVEEAKEWRDCLEIDMKLQESDYKEMSAIEFTDDFLCIKEEWKNICPVII